MLRANNDPCLNCERADCPGVCDRLREGMGEVDVRNGKQTIIWHGVERPVSEWAEILGVNRSTLYRKLEASESREEALSAALNIQTKGSNLPRGAVEEAYIRLSTMHLDYMLYWNRLNSTDSSAGMVARYGAVRGSPGGQTSNPTENRAMPELNLSDEALYRRGWVAVALYVIERYRVTAKSQPYPGDRVRAKLLEWRAIEGLTLKRMSERMNELMPNEYTPTRIRKYMEPVVQAVAQEAFKRGLIRGTQK